MKSEEVIIAPVRRAPLIPSTKRTLCYYFRMAGARLTAWFVAPFSLRNLSFASQKLKAQLAHVRLLLGAYAYSSRLNFLSVVVEIIV